MALQFSRVFHVCLKMQCIQYRLMRKAFGGCKLTDLWGDQTRAVLSTEPEASLRPSAFQATLCTFSLWPLYSLILAELNIDTIYRNEWVSCFPVDFTVMSTYLRTSDGSTTTVVKVAQSTSGRFPISFGCHIYMVVSRRRHVHIQAHSKVVEQEKKERRVGINWQSTLIQLWFVALGKVIFYYLLLFFWMQHAIR